MHPDHRVPTAHRLEHPAELLATLPTLLGFHPVRSLVLVALGGPSGRRLGLVVRADLPPPEEEAVLVAEVCRALRRDAPAAAVAVVVDAPAPGPPPSPRPTLVDRATAALAASGIALRAALWAEATTAGARWGCYEPCACRGSLPDRRASPLAAAAVVEGRVVHADRAALRRSVDPVDAGILQRRERLLVAAVDAAARDAAAEGVGSTGAAPCAAGPALLDATLAEAAAGRFRLSDERVVALALALADPAVRDAALVRCAGPAAAAAEQVWAALVRETPDPEAAEPAALLAVSALLRGDGALARVALERAEAAWPGHRLTGLLRLVVESGSSPEEVRAGLGSAVGSVGPRPVARGARR
jgi:hypothetical protein